MRRITAKELRDKIKHINKFTKLEIALDRAYGGYKITNADGSIEWSRRGTSREIDWFLDGIIAGQR